MGTPKLSFVNLMALDAIGDNTFMSKTPAWLPAGAVTYGGHVYAQAVWAASQTVQDGFVVHVCFRLRAIHSVLAF
jgi:acyl-CoA thioesterase